MFLKKLALATIVLLGILLLPIAADVGFTQCGSAAYQCGVPEYAPKRIIKATPRHVSPETRVITVATPPVIGGTWWRKSYRYGRWFENRLDYGSHYNYANQYNWNNWHGYGFPNDNEYSPMNYGISGNNYDRGGFPPSQYVDYAQQHARHPYGNGGNGLGGFDNSRYWRDATNNGLGAYSGPPAFDYTSSNPGYHNPGNPGHNFRGKNNPNGNNPGNPNHIDLSSIPWQFSYEKENHNTARRNGDYEEPKLSSVPWHFSH